MSEERDWRDDPALAHLRPDAFYVVCEKCQRHSWGGQQTGEVCNFPQPDGSRCDGIFGLPMGG